METIRIKADEIFKVEIEVEGAVIATQCVYMSSTEVTYDRRGCFYPVRPTLDFESRFEDEIKQL